MLSQSDRIAFSTAILSASANVAAIQGNQAQRAQILVGLQALDTANQNLFDPINNLIGPYQTEVQNLDGNGRTTFGEPDLLNASMHTLGNYFFPNNTANQVPGLPNGVWPLAVPYALGYGIGKTYLDSYIAVNSESSQITGINGQFTTAQGMYTDYQLTTGTDTMMDDAITIILNSIVAAVTALQATARAESAALAINVDTNATYAPQNAAAITNLNAFIAAMNTWKLWPNFDLTGSGPSKLHSTNFATLQSAFATRNSFTATRITQIYTVLGSISQDITSGNITASSGYYGIRYSYMNLRINTFNGSLSQISALNAASNAQTQMISNIQSSASTYSTLLSVGAFTASGSATNIIHIQNSNLFNPGDVIYVYADTQQELVRAIKSINNGAVTLNDAIPSTYTTINSARIYKDLT